MQELKTVADKLSRVQATVYRKLRDFNVRQLGTKTEALRITQTVPDNWGQTEESLKDFIMDSVYIKRPWSGRVQLFGQVEEATDNATTTAIDIWEFIPTEIFIPFEGDKDTEPVDLIKGDLIVQVLRDQYDTKIPIIYQITRAYGQITVFTLCGKQYDATLYRGTLAPSIQSAVSLYVNSIE